MVLWSDPGQVVLVPEQVTILTRVGGWGVYFWLGFFSGMEGQRLKWDVKNEEQKFFCKVLEGFSYQNFK